MNCNGEGAKQISGVSKTLWVQETSKGIHVKDLRKKLTKVPCGEEVGAEMQPTFPSPGPGSWSTGMLTQGGFLFLTCPFRGN